MKKISEIQIKIKLNLQKLNLYFYIALAIITLSALFFVSTFLYNNFYQVITQSDVIISLQGKVAQETVDMDKFNLIIKNIDKKTITHQLNDIKHSFSPAKE